jgi:predicted ArsR family transcriptional regulator
VFIYYSIKNICEDLNCGTQKACKLLDELEKVGALERKRQGLGRPNKLYLKKMF